MSDIRTPPSPARDSHPADATEIETMHDVLSDWERRAILYSLQKHGGSASVANVVTDIVAWRRGQTDPAPASDDVIARVHERVGPEQLLKLDEFGVLEYDPERDWIHLAEEMHLSISEPWMDHPTHAPRPPQSVDDEPDV